MSGPRDPSPFEESMYRDAVRTKNGIELKELFDAYPLVLWGSITESLSMEEQAWVMANLPKH